MNRKELAQYLKSLEQHNKDIDTALDNADQLLYEHKPIIESILDERPEIRELLEVTDSPEVLIEEKLWEINHLLMLLKDNLDFDLQHSNIPDDIAAKRKRIKALEQQYWILKDLQR